MTRPGETRKPSASAFRNKTAAATSSVKHSPFYNGTARPLSSASPSADFTLNPMATDRKASKTARSYASGIVTGGIGALTGEMGTTAGSTDPATSGNSTTTAPDPDRYSALGMIFTSIPVAVIIMTIVAGNALVIVAVLKDSRLKRQAQNWLIISLAAADLLVGLLIMPLTLAYELLNEWLLGDVLCELWLALDVLFVTASILNLCAISLDRYWSLTYPMRYPQQRTPRRMLFMIAVVWLSAFAISFPPLVGWRPQGRKANSCHLSDQLGYVLYSAVGSFYMPVSVLLFVYARIYCISRRRSKRKPTASYAPASSTPLFAKPSKKAYLNAEPTVTHHHTGASESSSVEDMRPNHAPLVNHERSATTETPITPELRFDEQDYIVLAAKVRALALLPRKDSLTMPSSDLHSCSTSNSTNTATTTPEKARLNLVAAVAAAAAAQSRQQRQADPLAQKAHELQKQLMQRRKLVRKRERQATVVLGLVLGTFVGSWMPFFSSYVLQAVCCQTPELLFDLIFWLGYCNSGLNPFIYNFFNRDFRRAFHRILCRPVKRLRVFASSKGDMRTRGSMATTTINTGATVVSNNQQNAGKRRLLEQQSLATSLRRPKQSLHLHKQQSDKKTYSALEKNQT